MTEWKRNRTSKSTSNYSVGPEWSSTNVNRTQLKNSCKVRRVVNYYKGCNGHQNMKNSPLWHPTRSAQVVKGWYHFSAAWNDDTLYSMNCALNGKSIEIIENWKRSPEFVSFRLDCVTIYGKISGETRNQHPTILLVKIERVCKMSNVVCKTWIARDHVILWQRSENIWTIFYMDWKKLNWVADSQVAVQE